MLVNERSTLRFILLKTGEFNSVNEPFLMTLVVLSVILVMDSVKTNSPKLSGHEGLSGHLLRTLSGAIDAGLVELQKAIDSD